MPDPDFLDTNILVHAYDPSDRKKQRIARELVRKAIEGESTISTQVLAEFAATILHKMKPAARAADVMSVLDALVAIPVVHPDAEMVRRAVEAHSLYGVHFYDGMIVAAAERAHSSRIWSEDLNAGQAYFGATVENPFL